MWFKMRAVDLDFLGTAPRVYTVERSIAAPGSAVWDAFSDPTTWRYWWPGVTSASYGSSPKPYGVGTFREATVSGQRYEETIVAWDAGRRFAYYIDRATVPIAKAQLECTEMEDDGTGTRVRWTIACEPRLLMRLGSPFFRGIMDRMLARALARLDVYLRVEGAVPACELAPMNVHTRTRNEPMR
jgi:carbon monoxide dehydrogenase subunit G